MLPAETEAEDAAWNAAEQRNTVEQADRKRNARDFAAQHRFDDALIIGAGPNGLVCAFYLAKAGLKVRIVEARDVVGGAAVS